MLRFRLFGIPVGVHVTFLFIALLGAATYRGLDIVLWTAAAFVSILSHEMGHALIARHFGAQGLSISLYGLGGVTTYTYASRMGHGKLFIISAAGSAVGIVMGGVLWFAVRAGVFSGTGHEVLVFVNSLFFTSLVWGVLNWIPIVPLDGGHMVEHFVAMFTERWAPLISQIITWLAVAVIAPLAWINGYRFGVVIVIMFALTGLREYRRKAAAARPRTVPTLRPRPDGVPPHQPRPAPPADPTSGEPPGGFPI